MLGSKGSTGLLPTITSCFGEAIVYEAPPEMVIERFKEGQNYKDLLIDETVSIIRTFSLSLTKNSPVFTEFVQEHFWEEYVVPLTDIKEESEDDGNEAHSDDGLGEDEEGGGDGAGDDA
ncbi:hypothetical protein LIER_01813 [Lithospermum erythrorhizon]|uniref:Uncharacterized protein n=1 Tax=Lithospermum erythrorhizon TaxID=34254 RepID=A0AAV3NM90_LITER